MVVGTEGHLDFRALLANDRCYDDELRAMVAEGGEPLADAILQDRDELVGLCEFIGTHKVRSFLEIGIWTGRLVTTLHRIFGFEKVACCDHGWAEQCGLSIAVPGDCAFYRGDSNSAGFTQFRGEQGHFDLVMIDANHHYKGVKADFELNRTYPHRFLAFHDIQGGSRQTVGVGRFWRELEGEKVEISRPGSGMGIGIWSAGNPGPDPSVVMRKENP